MAIAGFHCLGRISDSYSAAILCFDMNRVGEDEHPDRRYELTADNNCLFSRCLEPVFMRYLVLNLSFYTQYEERILATTKKSRGLANKIAALYSRLKAECLYSKDMKNYVSC